MESQADVCRRRTTACNAAERIALHHLKTKPNRGLSSLGPYIGRGLRKQAVGTGLSIDKRPHRSQPTSKTSDIWLPPKLAYGWSHFRSSGLTAERYPGGAQIIE